MPTLHHLIRHVREYGERHQTLYVFGLCIFFLIVFDGTIAYMLPIIMAERGFSTTQIGLMIGTSSIIGGCFDFLLAHFLRIVSIRRLFLMLFTVCLLYSLIIVHAHSIPFFLVAMALWGMYFDLYVFGTFDFVGRYTNHTEHASSFGFIQICASLGGLIAPVFAASALMSDGIERPVYAAWGALALSALCFFVVSLQLGTKKPESESVRGRRRNFFHELGLWKELASLIKTPVALTLALHMFNGLFWTLAPLYPDGTVPYFNALLLVAYGLPAVLVGWFVGPIARRLGKKRTAFGSLLMGSLILSLVASIENPFAVIACVFLASTFFGLAWPAISGAYADYISETPTREQDIEGVQDFFGNGGFILGPVLAGILAHAFGIPMTFTLFGILGAIIGATLLMTGKQSITIPA